MSLWQTLLIAYSTANRATIFFLGEQRALFKKQKQKHALQSLEHEEKQGLVHMFFAISL